MLISRERVSDFIFFYGVLGVIFGGRLGYVFFYSPDLLTEFSSQFPFWAVFSVHRGGMSSHGGMVGVILSYLFYSYRHKISAHHLLDLSAPGAALGFFFGRIANFVNGELYGRPSSEAWWSVKFPMEMIDWIFTQKQDKLQALAPVVERLGEIKGPGSRMIESVDSSTWTQWVLEGSQNLNFYVRFLVQQIQAGHSSIIESVGPFLTPRYPSQLFQALLEGLFVFIALNFIWLKPRKPGLIAASFAILYGFARMIGEQYRMPDVDIGYDLFGLTRGQWLSLVLILAGLIYLSFVLFQKNTQKLGGWFGEKTN